MVSNPQNVDLLIITDSDGIKCEKHNDKIIEFYCKDCKGLICSKWMLSLHYGHQLCLVEDSIGVLIKEMSDLEQYYDKHIGKEYTNSQRNIIIINFYQDWIL